MNPGHSWRPPPSPTLAQQYMFQLLLNQEPRAPDVCVCCVCVWLRSPSPDLLSVDSSAGHCWSSMVASFSCPNWAVAGSSPRSTRSSEDITHTAAGRHTHPHTHWTVSDTQRHTKLWCPRSSSSSSSQSPAGDRDLRSARFEEVHLLLQPDHLTGRTSK